MGYFKNSTFVCFFRLAVSFVKPNLHEPGPPPSFKAEANGGSERQEYPGFGVWLINPTRLN